MSKQFTFDTKQFSKDFNKLTLKKYPQAAEKGIRIALGKLKLDADNIVPKTPHKTGNLKAKTKIKVKTTLKETYGILTFRMPYAAYQHAGIRFDGSHKILKYVEPGTGAGFVSKKMARFNKKYMNIITITIRTMKGV